ncbi:MAG: hypothetical protein KME08_13490 [Aphanothece sp. CMT-3BRIN-NPC111]|jgi:hypothetical protein|nr:hypothetical protein [Aphanothece sp. CMT-3BRIN-NPC111]
MTRDLAILAPVPEEHLKSGKIICDREGKVAFGFSDKGFFDKVDSERQGAEVEVLIYASQTKQPIGLKVSWRAVYIGCVNALGGKHPEGDRFRPETTRSDSNWNAFCEVRDLRPLPNPIEISTLRGYGKKPVETYSAKFVPRQPVCIKYP